MSKLINFIVAHQRTKRKKLKTNKGFENEKRNQLGFGRASRPIGRLGVPNGEMLCSPPRVGEMR